MFVVLGVASHCFGNHSKTRQKRRSSLYCYCWLGGWWKDDCERGSLSLYSLEIYCGLIISLERNEFTKKEEKAASILASSHVMLLRYIYIREVVVVDL